MKCPTKWCRREVRKKGKTCSKCSMRAWRAKNPLKALLAMLRCRALRKKVPFNLDVPHLAELILTGCYDPKTHHIDRKIPSKGYTIGNLQILTAEDNIAKGNRERHVVDEPF